MEILMGPVLSLRRADAEHWCVSALVVAPRAAALESLDVKCIVAGEDAATNAPGKELWVHGQEAVYRYDIKIQRHAHDATRVESRFAGTPRPWSFHVPAASGKPRMAFVSCNGFSSAGAIKKVKDKNHLWNHMAELHSKNPYNVLLMGGDQLTSSGVVHPPPQKLLGWVLERLSDTPEPIDRGITGTMLPFPTKRTRFVVARNFLSLEPDDRDDRLYGRTGTWRARNASRQPRSSAARVAAGCRARSRRGAWTGLGPRLRAEPREPGT